MKQDQLSVAVPWSLSHYIPLNGFHPLYRALIDERPNNITLNAFDNVALSRSLRDDAVTRAAFLKYVGCWERKLKDGNPSPVMQEYLAAFFTPNLAATALLPGDIELHHTAGFPSLTRPFVLLCESFTPAFFPFAHQRGSIAKARAAFAHYEQLFASPLCLGVFSHIPDTLSALSRFFKSPVIDQKLFASRIGLSRQALPRVSAAKPAPGMAPGFLFSSQVHQNPMTFFHCGGHIALRAWPAILSRYPGAKLYLRCGRPEDALLAAHGVDLAFLKQEQTNSIIWIETFLTQPELNRLMARMHFFLMPSLSLHSASIMHAMALGAVPIVTDTIGTSRYLTPGENGIVLRGEFPEHLAEERDDSLVEQILQSVTMLLGDPPAYAALQSRAIATAAAEFSGSHFAAAFWQQVRELWAKSAAHAAHAGRAVPPPSACMASLRHCLVQTADWPRILQSVQQPMVRINTGIGQVTELGGAFIHHKPVKSMAPHDWSALAEFCREDGISLTFAASIAALGGNYLTTGQANMRPANSNHLVQWIARLLYPYPRLYRASVRVFHQLRRPKVKTSNLEIAS